MTMQKVEAALEAAEHAMEWAQPHLEADAVTEERGINEAHAHALAKVKDALALIRSDAQGERGGSTKSAEEANGRDKLARVASPPDRPQDVITSPDSKLIGSASSADTSSTSDWEAGAIRERILKCADRGIISWNAAQEVANRVLALPIPRRP